MSVKGKKAKTQRGGARPGAGAKPLDDEAGTMVDRIPSIRCSEAQRVKYDALGGPRWFRSKIDMAKVKA